MASVVLRDGAVEAAVEKMLSRNDEAPISRGFVVLLCLHFGACSCPRVPLSGTKSVRQTQAPSSVTPSAATFFGLMNCSRETPSHIARRFWGRLIQTQLPGAPRWKPAIFNADWTLIKSEMDEYKICSGRRYLGVSYLIATRAASARNPERVSPCLRAYSSIFASSKRGKVILTFSAGPK